MYSITLIWALIFLFGTISIHSRVPTGDFFSFGIGRGDERLPRGTTYHTSRRLDLSDPPFYYYGTMRDYARLSTWGEIGFSQGTVIPFSAEFDTSKQGNIFVRKSTGAADLGKARNEICSAFTLYCDVELRWVVIATFDRVIPCNFTYSGSNTLQAALTSDGAKTFVLLFYNNVDWFESYAADTQTIWHSRAAFSMHADNGTEYATFIPGSGTNQMLTLEHRSNCGQPGKWIYRVDGEIICAPDTPCNGSNVANDCHTQTYCPVLKWLLLTGCVVLITFVAVSLHLKRNICSFELLRGYFSRAQSAIQNLFHRYFRFQNDDTLLV
ncbi:nidogen-like domain-containing protein [Ditylenchus destructor]|uniref:Nidogen-like domain-containing protein n=1 Tax=Ditylenchus destructor TaxID=166010 RepID=A0AAD4MYR1_9BILA|nr:nidogen-like domain-containing protein [Ditylenchus destructor]